jgi:hypothetical protein
VEEKRLLIALSKTNKFSINGYSYAKKIPKSSTRSRLKKLERLGLIDYSQAPPRILDKGIIYLENTNQIEKQGDESFRLGGRENDESTHWHNFTLEIEDQSKFRKERLDFENCEWLENKDMNNWSEIIAKFNDATVIIKPNKLVIWLYDVVKTNTEEIDAICLRRLISYISLFKKLGIETKEVSIERGHWAKIESALAKWIYNTFEDKYELILDDGSKFFIDFSKNKEGIRKLEEETNRKIVRERVNKAMNGIGLGKYDLDTMQINKEDISEIREALFSITTMEKVRLMDKIEENKLERKRLELQNKKPELKLNYIPSYIN